MFWPYHSPPHRGRRQQKNRKVLFVPPASAGQSQFHQEFGKAQEATGTDYRAALVQVQIQSHVSSTVRFQPLLIPVIVLTLQRAEGGLQVFLPAAHLWVSSSTNTPANVFRAGLSPSCCGPEAVSSLKRTASCLSQPLPITSHSNPPPLPLQPRSQVSTSFQALQTPPSIIHTRIQASSFVHPSLQLCLIFEGELKSSSQTHFLSKALPAFNSL